MIRKKQVGSHGGPHCIIILNCLGSRNIGFIKAALKTATNVRLDGKQVFNLFGSFVDRFLRENSKVVNCAFFDDGFVCECWRRYNDAIKWVLGKRMFE